MYFIVARRRRAKIFGGPSKGVSKTPPSFVPDRLIRGGFTKLNTTDAKAQRPQNHCFEVGGPWGSMPFAGKSFSGFTTFTQFCLPLKSDFDANSSK